MTYTYEEAEKEVLNYKHLIGTPFITASGEVKGTEITHFVIAPVGKLVEVLGLWLGEQDNKKAVLGLGSSFSKFAIYLISYDSWNSSTVLHEELSQYLKHKDYS